METVFNTPYSNDEIWSAVFGSGVDEQYPWYAAYTEFIGGHGEGWDDSRNVAKVYLYHEDDYEEVSPMTARVKTAYINFEDLWEGIRICYARTRNAEFLNFDAYDADTADYVLQTIVYGKYTFG